MCIRDRNDVDLTKQVSHDLTLILQCRPDLVREPVGDSGLCLLYTSDAADDLLCVDLGGRRIIKQKKHNTQ